MLFLNVISVSQIYLYIYIKSHPGGTINYDDAGHILGTYEEQTIRKHIVRGWKIVNQTILKILTLIAALPGFVSIPEKKPGKELLAYLEEIIDEVHRGCIRMGKRILRKPQKDLYLHMVYWFEKSRNPIICTLDHVFINLHLYDTS